MMRVRLSSPAGTLAAVATLLGRLEVDINRLEIRAKNAQSSVVDFLLDLPRDRQPESVLDGCRRLKGVSIERFSSYPAGGGIQYDLEIMQRMASDPADAAKILVEAAPLVCEADWAVLLHASDLTTEFATTLAPELHPDRLELFRPFHEHHAVELTAGWMPGQIRTAAAVIAMPQDHLMAVGRIDGPAFTDSELARLGYLADMTSV
jgi:hypothetical protein